MMSTDDRYNRKFSADLAAAANALMACAELILPGHGAGARLEKLAARLRDYACTKPAGRLRQFSRN